MKTAISVIGLAVMALALMVPGVAAQEASVEAESVTMGEIRMAKIGDAFADLGFRLRSAFTFSQEGRLDLLAERHEQLKTRQEAWLDFKARAEADAEARQNVVSEIRSKHEAIIRDHLRLTAEMRDIRVDAESRGRAELAQRAETHVNAAEESGLSLGLEISGLQASARAETGIEARTSIRSEADAKAFVESRLGISVDNISTETRNGVEYYVALAKEVQANAESELVTEYEVWVDARTGVVDSVETKTSVRSLVDVATSISGSVQGNNDTSASAQAGASAGAESEGTSGSASVNANASVGVGIN